MVKEKKYKIEEELVYSTLLLSNSQDDEYIVDAKKIVSFICDSFELEDSDKEKYYGYILDRALCMCTYEDAMVYFQNKDIVGALSNEELNIFQIKATILKQMHDCHKNDINYDEVQHYIREYFYSRIDNIANKGRSRVVELLAILKILGIGCEKNLDEAIDLFKGLIYWLPFTCVPYLKQAYKLKKDKENYAIYVELEKIMENNNPYRKSILPAEDEKIFSEKAKDLYRLISSFQIDVINEIARARKETTFDVLGDVIDYSFAEAITSEKINYKKKMELINNYDKRGWLDLTNNPNKYEMRIGF